MNKKQSLNALAREYECDWHGYSNRMTAYSMRLRMPDLEKAQSLANEMLRILLANGTVIHRSPARNKDSVQFGICSIYKSRNVTVLIKRKEKFIGILSERTDADYSEACVVAWLGVSKTHVMQQMWSYLHEYHIPKHGYIFWSEKEINDELAKVLSRFRFNIQAIA